MCVSVCVVGMLIGLGEVGMCVCDDDVDDEDDVDDDE